MARATLREIELPDFGMPEMACQPSRTAIYGERLGRFRDRLAARGYDFGFVYADREHSANLAYLTGFDPRFEEAVLIVGPTGPAASADRERVRRHGRGRTTADASRTPPGSQPSEPTEGPVASACRDPQRAKVSRPASGSG